MLKNVPLNSKHFPCKNLQQFLLLQCPLWKQYFVILRKKKYILPILMGQQLPRNGALQEMESGVLGAIDLGCMVSRNSPRKSVRSKICFLTYRFSLSLSLFFIVDILPPGYPLHSHLIALCKGMAGLVFQTMWDDVQDLTRNQQLRLAPWPREWKYSLWKRIS